MFPHSRPSLDCLSVIEAISLSKRLHNTQCMKVFLKRIVMMGSPDFMSPSRANEHESSKLHTHSQHSLLLTCDTDAGPSACIAVLHSSRCRGACSNRRMLIGQLRDCESGESLGICNTLVPIFPRQVSNLVHIALVNEELSHASVRTLKGATTTVSYSYRNSRGYDVAKQHKEKFSHICPVWYQLKVQDDAPVLTGGHDMDAGWIIELREPKDEVCAPTYLISILAPAHSLPP